MSFSVEAQEFIPASPGRRFLSQRDGCAEAKQRVCMSFFECGECPFAENCEHAHSFFELNSATQTKLLSTMSMEQIPRYFLKAATVSGASTASFPRRDTHTALAKPSQRRVVRQTCQQRLPLDMSVSSQTSSSAAYSKLSSPMASASDSSFKMRLPARCRYPHQHIPGTYYDALGLPIGASEEDVMGKYYAWRSEGYKRMRLIDPTGADTADRLIVEARNVLGSPFFRREYDRTVPGTMENAWSKGLGSGHDTSVSQCGYTQGHSSTVSSSASDKVLSAIRPTRLSSSVTSHASANSLSNDIW